jgi:hypothetical protein
MSTHTVEPSNLVRLVRNPHINMSTHKHVRAHAQHVPFFVLASASASPETSTAPLTRPARGCEAARVCVSVTVIASLLTVETPLSSALSNMLEQHVAAL